MSWQDDINSYPFLTIITGDGSSYDFKTKFRGGSIDPLTGVYNYAGKVGTKTTRNSSASPIYDLTFYVPQDLMKSFIISVSDPTQEWTVKHPLFGDLKGHPTGTISFDNTRQGDVEWIVQFQDNIREVLPQVFIDYKQKVIDQNSLIQATTVTEFTDKLPSVEEVNIFDSYIDDLETVYESITNSEYANTIYDIRQVINNEIFDSARFMQLNNKLLNIGSTLTLEGVLYPVQTRIQIMNDQLSVILAINENVETESSDGNTSDTVAVFKEFSGAVGLGALAISIATPTESQNDVSGFDVTDVSNVETVPDYRFKKDVDSTINNANLQLNNYIESLDAIDLEIQGNIKYSPDKDINSAVTNVILLGVQEVKEISEKARVETTHITEKDTFVELLAYELYGSATEQNTQEIIDANDLFGKNSRANSWRNFVIRKNTKIKYYA